MNNQVDQIELLDFLIDDAIIPGYSHCDKFSFSQKKWSHFSIFRIIEPAHIYYRTKSAYMKGMSSDKLGLPTNKGEAARNFGLTPATFEELVLRLQQGDQQLFKTIFLAHFEECQRYLRHQKQISAELAYDVTMDAMLLFRKKLVDGKIRYGNMRFLFTQMANQLFLKSLRGQPQMTTLNGLEHLEEEVSPFQKEEMAAFNRAWSKLCEECSGLLKKIYYSKTSSQQIAVETQKTAASIRKKKQRCVEKLRGYFAEYYTP